jgi:hypothetical protein
MERESSCVVWIRYLKSASGLQHVDVKSSHVKKTQTRCVEVMRINPVGDDGRK